MGPGSLTDRKKKGKKLEKSRKSEEKDLDKTQVAPYNDEGVRPGYTDFAYTFPYYIGKNSATT